MVSNLFLYGVTVQPSNYKYAGFYTRSVASEKLHERWPLTWLAYKAPYKNRVVVMYPAA